MGETNNWEYTPDDESYCGCTQTDVLKIPLSYTAHPDGSFTIECNANFYCPSHEAHTLNTMTCIASGVTATPTTHAGTGNLGASWTVPRLSSSTTFTVSISINHYGTKAASNTITLPASATLETYRASTVTHSISISNIEYAESQQWQESTDGTNWADISGATADTLIIGTWTGADSLTEAAAISAVNSIIPAYNKYYRCIASNSLWQTISNVLHVVHAGGAGTPTVTTI